LIIGEGGIYPLALNLKIPELTICDIKYQIKEKVLKSHKILTENLIKFNYDGKIYLISGIDLKHNTSDYDTIWITGSTLCNNSLIKLKRFINNAEKSILQGPSCSVYPTPLFKLGITDILTTIKSKYEIIAGKLKTDHINYIVDKDYIHMYKKS